MNLHAKTTFHDVINHDINGIVLKNYLFSFVFFSAEVTCVSLAYKKQWRNYQIKQFSSEKNGVIFHMFVVNRVVPSWHGLALEITLTVPFILLFLN